MRHTALDCQGFAGGFTLGVAQAGFTLIGKREMRGGFGVANCEANRHLLGNEWRSEAVNPEEWSAPYADLVFGNPPCSGFSVLSSKAFRGVDSKINSCMWAFAEYAARVRPQVAIFESVPLAFAQGGDLMRALRAWLEQLTGQSWTLTHVLHNAYSVGGPAMRKRYFWVASRLPFGVERPRLPRVPLLRDVIEDLVPLGESWGPQVYGDSEPTWYSSRLRSASGTVDGHVSVDNPHTRRTRDLRSEVDWHYNEHAQKVTRRHYELHGRLPQSWAATEEKLVRQDFFQGFNTPTMWNPDHPARVITGGGLYNGVHWALNRTFTHREAARILGFPDDWLIEPLRKVSGLHMTWGKGITVDCGRWIARWASRALDGEPGTYVGDPIGDREFLIDVTNDWKSTCGTVNTSAPRLKAQGTAVKQRGTTVSETETLASPTVDASAPRRGRPRPEDTKTRDEQVFEYLTEPMSRERIAVDLGLESKLVYLSLYRLRRGGRVERRRSEGGGHAWTRTAPAEAAPAE